MINVYSQMYQNKKIIQWGYEKLLRCSLGSTAKFIQENKWGMVTGIDIDEYAIHYAKQTYPNVSFSQCSVNKVTEVFLHDQFDLTYMFSAFFSFKAQRDSLKALAPISKTGGKLVIFDYSTTNGYQGIHPFPSNNIKPFTPINLKTIPSMLFSAEWQLDQVVDLSDHFLRWYQTILNHLARSKKQLISQFNQAAFDKVYNRFQTLAQLLENKLLGGVIVYATKI